MVVVILVAILAMVGVPTMRTARDDRMAFDYARQVAQLGFRAKSRAAARQGAHLMIFDTSAAGHPRGNFLLFEALDGETPATGGPRPVSSCKARYPDTGTDQWNEVVSFAPGVVGQWALLVEGLNLDTNGVNVDMNVWSTIRVSGAPQPVVAMCVTAAGVTYVGAGSSISAAIAQLPAADPFSGTVDISIQRHQGTTAGAGVGIGLERHVYFTAGGAPRVRSR